MSIWGIFAIYVVMSASGLFLIKTGAETSGFAFENQLFNFHVSPRLIIGFVIYVCSFLMSVYIISRMKLTVFYPVATGSVLVMTCLLGFFVLKEHIGVWQLLGMALILAGVVALNIRPA